MNAHTIFTLFCLVGCIKWSGSPQEAKEISAAINHTQTQEEEEEAKLLKAKIKVNH